MNGLRAALRQNRVRAALRYIGGPAAVTWQGLLAAYTVSLLGYLAAGPSDVSMLGRFSAATAAAVAGFVPLVLVYFMMRRRLAEQPRPVLMLSMYVVMAAIRNGITVFTSVSLGIDEHYRVGFRLFSAMPALVLALALTAIIVGSAREQAARLAELEQIAHALTEAQEHAEFVVADEQAKVVDRIAVTLQGELDHIDMTRPTDASDHLRRLSADVVRPLSHELARAVPTWTPTAPEPVVVDVSPLAVLRQVARGQPFAEIPTAAMIAALGAGTLYAIVSPVLAVGLLIGLAGGTVLVLVLLNSVLNAIPDLWPRWVRPAGFVAAAVLFSATVATYMAAAAPLARMRPRLAVSAFLLALMFSVLFGVAKAYAEVQVSLERSLREQNARLRWSVARARQVQWCQQRVLARVLHGPVQATINAARIRLGSAMRDGDDVGVVVASVKTTLRDTLADTMKDGYDTASLDDLVVEITALWSGVCEIGIDIDAATAHALDADAICRTMVSAVLTEGSVNAVRHGRATRLRMTVWRHGDLVSVRVEDDGAEPAHRGPEGLGSQLLDECAVSWRRVSNESGNSLTADLPVTA